MEQTAMYPYDDECTGCHYEIPVEDCEHCSKCGSYFIGPKSMRAIRKFVDEYRAVVLIEQNGFDKEHWMDSKEAAEAFGMPRKRFLKYGLVNLFVHECNGDVYVFRKSAEKSLANGGGSGLFYIGNEAKKEEWLAYLEDKRRIKDGQLEDAE